MVNTEQVRSRQTINLSVVVVVLLWVRARSVLAQASNFFLEIRSCCLRRSLGDDQAVGTKQVLKDRNGFAVEEKPRE